MVHDWIDEIKGKIIQRYLIETGTKLHLIIWLIFTGIVIFGLLNHIRYMIKESPQNKIKVEKTGNVESIASGFRELVITLENGEKYGISGGMYYYYLHPFNKDEFLNEVKKGDELHLVVWQDDKDGYQYPSVYQLECNNKVYLSYEKAIGLVQRQLIIELIEYIFAFLFCGSFFMVALIRHIKKKLNKGNSEKNF